ncbi:hypothetical protein BX666DRAFT_1936904 [Dichotomocladium elegans]|nr:hypothetical protein BX666DRAFT_1936904 [Dichotomocladium elegans]
MRRPIPYLLLFLSIAFAYPHAPGTCNFDLMGTIGHGPSRSKCEGCYSVNINQDDPARPIRLTISGRRPFQGLLVQVKNGTGQTVGEFVDYNLDEYGPVVCEEETDREEGWAGNIGHVDAKLKNWPVELYWSSATQDVYDSLSSDFFAQVMVVLDYDNYHILPEGQFKVHKVLPESTAAAAATTPVAPMLPEVTLIASQPVEKDEEPNTLFLQVFSLLLIVYFAMALLQRRWRGRTAVNPEEQSKDDTQKISQNTKAV